MQIPSGKNQGGNRKNQINRNIDRKIPKGSQTLFGIFKFYTKLLEKNPCNILTKLKRYGNIMTKSKIITKEV